MGFLNEAYKLLTRAKRTKERETRVQQPHQLIALVQDQDRIQDELSTLLGGNTPKHSEVGLQADKWARTLSGLRFPRNISITGLQQLQETYQAAVGHIQKLEGQDKASAIELWIERILDA